MAKKKKEETKRVEDEILSDFAAFEKQQAESADLPTAEEPVKIRISADKLKAVAIVLSPVEAAKEVTKEDLIAALKSQGVVYGIDEAAIDEIFQYGSFGVDVPVAKGKEPSDGVSAKIDFKFDISGEKKVELKIDEHGNVDHKAINLIKSIEEGEVLALKIPAVKGETGMTVTGATLPAKEGKDIPLPAGENVKVSEDGLTLTAEISGQPIYKDGKVSVSPVYVVKGDVSYATGNINFKGTVTIEGGVQSDFVVNATDDIEVHGNIEKAYLEAGGDVRVRGGLYGQSEGKISAGGSVTIRSIESGIVEAGKNIIITQSSRYSTLIAGEDIILNNVKGSIVGGKATAGRTIDVTNLGSQSFTETAVEVGVNPKIKEMQVSLEEKIKENRQHLEKALHSIKTLKEMQSQGSLPPDKVELMKKLVPAAHQLKNAIEADTAKLNFIHEKLKSMQAGRLKINKTIFPNVKITTIGATMTVRKEINHSSFYEQNEQIIVGPY
ncbi:MAG: FapA family protein [bacterium]